MTTPVVKIARLRVGSPIETFDNFPKTVKMLLTLTLEKKLEHAGQPNRSPRPVCSDNPESSDFARLKTHRMKCPYRGHGQPAE